MLAEDHNYAELSDEENVFGAKTQLLMRNCLVSCKDLRKKISKQKRFLFCDLSGSLTRRYGNPVSGNNR